MIGKRVLALVFGAGLVLSVAAQAGPTVRIATNSPYRPMEYTQPDGTLAGFDIDLGNALCRQAHLKCTWSSQSWDGIIPGLLTHKYDAIMSTMSITPERRKHVLFSDGYLTLSSRFFVPESSAIHKIDKAALKDKRIGVQRGTLQDQYATAHFGDVAIVKRYKDADTLATDMAAGRLDTTLLTQITGRQSLMQPSPGRYRMVGAPIIKNRIGIAFRKGDTRLAKTFNAALTTLRRNGTYARIRARYFPAADTDQ